MPEQKAKLTLKVGEKEVHFEAGLEAVETQLGRLAGQLLRQSGADERAVLSVAADLGAARTIAHDSAESSAQSPERPPKPGFTLEAREIEPLYATDAAGGLRLRVLPETSRKRIADSLLLLLYGLAVLRGRRQASGPELLRGAHASGLYLTRADRALTRRPALVATTGRKGGKRYRLTDDGAHHCEGLIRRMSWELRAPLS